MITNTKRIRCFRSTRISSRLSCKSSWTSHNFRDSFQPMARQESHKLTLKRTWCARIGPTSCTTKRSSSKVPVKRKVMLMRGLNTLSRENYPGTCITSQASVQMRMQLLWVPLRLGIPTKLLQESRPIAEEIFMRITGRCWVKVTSKRSKRILTRISRAAKNLAGRKPVRCQEVPKAISSRRKKGTFSTWSNSRECSTNTL